MTRTREGGDANKKLPLGATSNLNFAPPAHGDGRAMQRAVFSLEKQRALIDPVWGGILQYPQRANERAAFRRN